MDCLWRLQVQKPRKEDIECLCKLMATIGGQLEASQKAKGYIDSYCARMEGIRNLPQLEVSPAPPTAAG